MKGQMSFHEVLGGDLSGISEVERLAREIWNEHYPSIIGQAQVDYMLDNFQSSAAVRSQIKEGYRYFLVELQGQHVGYFAVQLLVHGPQTHREMFLSKLYVLSSSRGHGVGKRTMAHVEALAREAGAFKVSLMVNKSNLGSIRFYERQGFLNCGPIFKDIGGGFAMDDYIFEKVL